MRIIAFNLIALCFFASTGIHVYAETEVERLGDGWMALATQSDPFDSSAVDIIQVSKGGFTFRCGQLNMEVASTGFDGMSFGAEIRYVIDGNQPKNKDGKFSTYLGGSDMVTDSRYFSFKLTQADIEAMKSWSEMKVAGKFST